MSFASAAASPVEPSRLLRAELSDYLEARSERRRIFPRAALVGLLSGLVAVAFRFTLDGGQWVREWFAHFAHGVPVIGPFLTALVCGLLAMSSVLLVRRLAPEAAGSGIPHLEAVLRRYRPFVWERILPVKFVTGAIAVGFAGMALGREGPTVQMGASVGDGVARLLKGSFRDRETLILAGAGAGLAAAFNAPLAGLVFVLEEIRRDFSPLVFGAALVAAVVADVVSRFASGQNPVFAVPAYPTPAVTLLPAFALLGAAMGLFGVLFNRSLLQTLDIFGRLKRVPMWLPSLAVGAIVGVVVYFRPEAAGSGHQLADAALAGTVGLAAIPALIAIRFGLTMICYGCGAPGGIFAPLLAVGALAGLAAGSGLHTIWPGLVPAAGVFAVVGMAAYFAAIVRAPLTGIVLIVEMTGSYALMLPLLVACLSAYLVAEGVGDRPIYEALLERDLLRGGLPTGHTEGGTEAFSFDVAADSGFAGKSVRDLGLPPGCVLVSRTHERQESVPTASTVLLPGDRLVVIVDEASAVESLPLLRAGFGSAAHHISAPGD